jgi:zinc protease
MTARSWFVALLALLAPGFAVPAPAQTAAPGSPDAVPIPTIAAERFVLPNGLTVMISPDHSAPIVAVTVWYHVGSKNEVPGRTGFAHLFEHVMFQGSEHASKGEHIKIVEDAGGSMNGSTNNDRTNYFETVPVNYLETVLWLESDRMGYLLSALTQEKLDNQRDVVKNERRFRVDNQPFGRSGEVQSAALFPSTNPYSWPVIGSMSDLSAASLDDVKQFFRTYYAPDNAVLSVCGDVDVARTKALVERYFAPIPRGPGITRPTVAPALLSTESRLVLEDPKATLPRLTVAWGTVGVHSPDRAALEALAALLTQDRTSLLTKLLVYDRELATNVSATAQSFEDEGTFRITVSPRPGVSLTTVEQLVDSVVASVAAAPPSAEEVQRTKSYALVGTTTGLEPVLSRAETLARGQTYFGDPLHYKAELQDAGAITPADIQRVAKQYLVPGRIVLSMVPAGKLNLVSKPSKSFTNTTTAPEAPSAGGH